MRCKRIALPAELHPLIMVGLGRLELPTSRLSGVRSNHLSYKPLGALRLQKKQMYGQLSDLLTDISADLLSLKGGDPAAPSDTATLLRLHPSY